MHLIVNSLLAFFYWLMGLLAMMTGIRCLRFTDDPKRMGTSIFWILLGIIFALGDSLPYAISGMMLAVMATLTLFKQVKLFQAPVLEAHEAKASAKRLGNKIFLPSIVLALVAVGISYTPLGGQVGVAVGSLTSLLVAIFLTKATPTVVLDETDRMLQAVGPTGILPQLLAALGIIFTTAGVGDVLSQVMASVIPAGSRFLGVVAYCVSMALFTMLMGNAFAAFTVITAGIGIPFVIAQGADPVVAGALAMTAGFCGTLLTPMAANFNALPAALLGMKDPQGVIKAQLPVALVLLVIHILLMYYIAF